MNATTLSDPYTALPKQPNLDAMRRRKAAPDVTASMLSSREPSPDHDAPPLPAFVYNHERMRALLAGPPGVQRADSWATFSSIHTEGYVPQPAPAVRPKVTLKAFFRRLLCLC